MRHHPAALADLHVQRVQLLVGARLLEPTLAELADLSIQRKVDPLPTPVSTNRRRKSRIGVAVVPHEGSTLLVALNAPRLLAHHDRRGNR